MFFGACNKVKGKSDIAHFHIIFKRCACATPAPPTPQAGKALLTRSQKNLMVAMKASLVTKKQEDRKRRSQRYDSPQGGHAQGGAPPHAHPLPFGEPPSPQGASPQPQGGYGQRHPAATAPIMSQASMEFFQREAARVRNAPPPPQYPVAHQAPPSYHGDGASYPVAAPMPPMVVPPPSIRPVYQRPAMPANQDWDYPAEEIMRI